MKYIHLQEVDYDCGLSCIKMMLAHYHRNKRLLNLDKEIINSRYSFYSLKLYAQKYNLELEGIDFTEKELIFNYPCSTCQVNNYDLSHFIIFEKKKGKYVYLIDPTIGRIRMLVDEFLNVFTGKALIKKDVIPLKLTIKKEKNENLNYLLVYITFLVLDFGLLIIISYLGNYSKYIFHSILIILALLLSIICKLKLLNRHQDKIDKNIKKILESGIKLKPSINRGLLSYKMYIVKHLYGVINNVFIIFFISLILLVNGLYNAIIIIVLFSFSYLISSINLVKENTLVYKINQLENRFISTGSCEVYNDLLVSSKRIQSNNSLIMIIYQSIIIFGITIINNLTKINSFEFIVFNTIYYLLLFSKFNYINKDSKRMCLEYKKYSGIYSYLLKKADSVIKISENE